MRLREGRSVARRNAEWSPWLSGLRSLSIVRSQDWRGRPLGQCQSTGRRSVDARSAREWSSEAAARAICPNSLRRHCCISEETGGWLVCDHTDPLVTCAAYGTRRIRRKHHWSKASRCCLDASVTLHDTVGFYAWMWWEVTKPCGAASLSHLAANALRWLNHFFYSV